MKAVMMRETGGPGLLRLEDVPLPELTGPHDLLVRLKAAGVNPVDAKLRARGTYFPDRLPCILGCDGAGVVERVGEAVTRFRPGDEVYFCNGGIGGDPGNYAEYTTVHEGHAARKPDSLSFPEAAAAPLVLITAWESLHDRARLEPGQRVLVHAGAGGVGHVALQLVRQAGAEPCVTVGDREKAAFVRGLGADAVLNYREQDFAAGVLEWTGGKGADVALDTVGGETFTRTFGAVAHYGDLVTLLQPPVDTDWTVARSRNLRIGLELMLTPMAEGLEVPWRHQAEILERCATLFDEGRLTIKVNRTLPLEKAGEAHQLLEQGGMIGKLVLTMDAA